MNTHCFIFYSQIFGSILEQHPTSGLHLCGQLVFWLESSPFPFCTSGNRSHIIHILRLTTPPLLQQDNAARNMPSVFAADLKLVI